MPSFEHGDEGIQVRAQAAPWNRAIELLVRQGGSHGLYVVWHQEPEGKRVDPTLCLDLTAAQTLMDDLWNAGLRPTEGSGSAGSLRSTEKHLADMRKIAFKGLDIEG